MHHVINIQAMDDVLGSTAFHENCLFYYSQPHIHFFRSSSICSCHFRAACLVPSMLLSRSRTCPSGMGSGHQTHGVDSIHLWRHFSSKSLPSTIQRPQARIDYQNMIIDPSNESYVNREKFQSESPQTQPEQDL